jgi:hypothetical protein
MNNTLLEIVGLEIVVDLFMILVPAAIVFFVTHYFITKFFGQEREKRNHDLKQLKFNTLSPLKIQAYERLTIFLDRITPQNLIVRNAGNTMNATQFKYRLVQSVQEEFNHNVSQQLYISDQSWAMVKLAMDYVLATIENCYKDMPEDAKGIDLGKAVLIELGKREKRPVETAIAFLKKEIELVY